MNVSGLRVQQLALRENGGYDVFVELKDRIDCAQFLQHESKNINRLASHSVDDEELAEWIGQHGGVLDLRAYLIDVMEERQ